MSTEKCKIIINYYKSETNITLNVNYTSITNAPPITHWFGGRGEKIKNEAFYKSFIPSIKVLILDM